MPELRTLAFGDHAAGVWGAAWLPDDGRDGFICLGAPDAAPRPSARVEGDDEHGDWRLLDEDTELRISPAGEAVSVVRGVQVQSAPAPEGFEQLCRVQGRIAHGSGEHAVDCLARRAVRSDGLDLERVESVRDLSAWFEPDSGLGLNSLRPRGATGHDADVITAAVLDPESGGPVGDPRFSTTYNAEGWPIRSSFELWMGETEDEYPRRAAGEAAGPHARQRRGNLEVQASLFSWHSRGRDGTGVYILARPV